jgi:hypothetical protein
VSVGPRVAVVYCGTRTTWKRRWPWPVDVSDFVAVIVPVAGEVGNVAMVYVNVVAVAPVMLKVPL